MMEKKVIKIASAILFCTIFGAVLGWFINVFQLYTHEGEPLLISDIRGPMNIFIGGIFGFFLGLIRVKNGDQIQK